MTRPPVPSNFDLPDWLEAVLRAKVQEQPLWKKYSNTFATIVSGLVTLVWWLIGTGVELPQWTLTIVGIALYLASILGIKSTKNGLTETTVNEITSEVQDYVGKHRAAE